MEYSIRQTNEELITNIDTAYTRATENAANARELAMSSEWLWGPNASFQDYEYENIARHQLTGEISRFGHDYRGEDYWICADPIAKELITHFPTFVLESTQYYIAQYQDSAKTAEERMVALDHAKQFGLTLFHAAQYPARTRMLQLHEIATLKKFSTAAEHLTRAFYQTVLGHETFVTDAETAAALAILQDPEVVGHMGLLEVKHFKHQELDQPLTILSTALLAVDKYPETDIIYGLPAGGTQNAIVTQMLYQQKFPDRVGPVLHYLPISTHSLKKEALTGVVSPTVEHVVRRSKPYGKHTLICEDNSNTGTTLSLATDVVGASSPRSCHVSMVEFDPKRLEVKNRNLAPTGHVANYTHPDF